MNKAAESYTKITEEEATKKESLAAEEELSDEALENVAGGLRTGMTDNGHLLRSEIELNKRSSAKE